MAIDYTIHGNYTQDTLAGNLFHYRVPSQAFLLNATTGGHPTLINPSSSGKVFIPVAVNIGFISGTTVIGSLELAVTLNVGSGAATGSPLLTATLVAANAAYVGAGAQSVMQWSPTTNTFTAAPTMILPLFNVGAVSPTNGGQPAEYLFNGKTALYPGNAFSLCYSVTTSTSVWWTTLIGVEAALPPQLTPS